MRWLGGAVEVGPPQGTLAPIRIFTSDLELDGYVAPAGQRITDMLLRGLDLAFLPAGADAVPENWISISPTDVLMASPPPLSRRSAWRASREERRVSFRIGQYSVSGTAHVRPDAASVAEVASRQAFLPLTDAELMRNEDAGERYTVLIVNTAAATPVPTSGS